MKTFCLSIDQMKRLAELGLDTSDASMIYINHKDNTNSSAILIPKDEGLKDCIVYNELSTEEDNCVIYNAYILQDILLHLTPLHRQMVMKCESDEWLEVAYELLVFQLLHKEDFV